MRTAAAAHKARCRAPVESRLTELAPVRGEFLPVPLLSCITIGPPMWLEPKENKLDFLKRARDAVRRLKDV